MHQPIYYFVEKGENSGLLREGLIKSWRYGCVRDRICKGKSKHLSILLTIESKEMVGNLRGCPG